MEKDDPAYPVLRPLVEEDLKDFKYEADRKCDNCNALGSYRTSDFWLCKKDMIKICRVEID